MPCSLKDLTDTFALFGSVSVIIDQITKNDCSMTKSFVKGGTFGIVFGSTVYIINKIKKHFGDIEELFERVEKCEERQEDHNLKK